VKQHGADVEFTKARSVDSPSTSLVDKGLLSGEEQPADYCLPVKIVLELCNAGATVTKS
jgi:hypothetical protein